MSAKLSKKELKSPDAFQSTFERVGDYVSDNKTRVMVVAAALVCAVVVALGIYFYWSHYTNSALKLYAKAQSNILKSGDTPQTATENIKIFNELIEKYPYSWSGRMAYYHLGNIYYSTGELDKAIKSYSKFAGKTGSDKTGLKFLALTSLGYAYEAKKDFKEALKYFNQAQTAVHTGFESLGLRNIARSYEELNNKEKALEYYKKALEKTTEPSATLLIKRKISALS
ncbi:MAG: tetratricopeptide repeat protein [Syntrophaceae bacterium]|jgi:tetratricopeptide (TPR) repeat protein|nr:tetratricopeptide repeat protein [Syntrophaceae bacterium]